MRIKKVQEKIGENMNRKIMILMVAVVATVLPAVAVADVMITGSVQGLGHSTTDAFIVEPGSNYVAANATAGFGWKAITTSPTEVLGQVTVGYMSNETIFEWNVLEINFTGKNTGNFNLTVNGNSNVNGVVYMFFSKSPFPANGTAAKGTSIVNLSAHSTSPYTYTFDNVNSNTHIYFAFWVYYSMAPFSFTMNMAYSA